MTGSLNAILIVTGWAFFIGASGAFFALGFIIVCRWLDWSPVNTKVILNNYFHEDHRPSPTKDKA